MKTKNVAKIIGLFILLAYGVLISEFTQLNFIVMIADSLSGLAVIGISVLIFPYFKPTQPLLAKTYLSLKFIEGALMIVGGLTFLNNSLHFIRDWIYQNIHLYTFIIGGFLFYWLLYKSKLIPRFISIWGVIAITALLTSTILKFFHLSYSLLDVLLVLIITNEVFLSFWLIIKGFNPNSLSRS